MVKSDGGNGGAAIDVAPTPLSAVDRCPAADLPGGIHVVSLSALSASVLCVVHTEPCTVLAIRNAK